MKVLLLDGYNLFYRARYSGMNKGQHSTVFNFFRSLRPLVEKFSPDKIYCILEGMPKKRLQECPEYKGQRVYDNKDNFSEQRKEIIRLLKEYFPIQIVKHDDFECDDIIGHIASSYDTESNEVTIVSSDTDFIQSITENVSLYNPVRKSFIEKPDYDYITWKALKGDASDNIEGFKGIGNKRALTLTENTDKLNSFLNSEPSNTEKFNLNKWLIKFHDLNEEEINNIQYYPIPQTNWDKLKEEFTNMEFNSIVSKEKTWNKFTNTFER